MKKDIFRLIKNAFLLALCILLFLILIPRTYKAPQQQNRKSTQYWNLATGSRIGYTHIPAKGINIHTPVIFLQGGPGGCISDRNIEILAQLANDGYDVYLYDQIGSGHSNRLINVEEYTAGRHISDLEEIIKEINSKKVILIGQSWGAILATLFIADNPDKVDKLILTGPGPLFPMHVELANLKAPDSLHLRDPLFSNSEANKKINNWRTKFVAFLAREFHIKVASDNEMDDFSTLLSNETNKSTVCDTSKVAEAKGGSGYYSQIMTMQSLSEVKDPRPKLINSKIPLLLMKGQCDNQRWGFATEYLELFPNHKLVIVNDAGHSIAAEQPDFYLRTIRDFLNR
ncbi:MAG: alpha/beta fold hydrolase [Bacteroidales bacterium]